MPLTQIFSGGFVIFLMVQSPALLTTMEYPFSPGTAIVANECHSKSGLSEMRAKLPGTGLFAESAVSRCLCPKKDAHCNRSRGAQHDPTGPPL